MSIIIQQSIINALAAETNKPFPIPQKKKDLSSAAKLINDLSWRKVLTFVGSEPTKVPTF